MENQTSSKNIIINHGLYFGLLMVLTSVIFYALGMHFEVISGFVNFGVIFLGIIIFPLLGIKSFKKSNDNHISWGEGVKIGVGIVLIATLISTLYQIVFTNFIEPDFYAQLEEVTRNGLLNAGQTESQIDQQIEMQSKFQGTAAGFGIGILFMTFIGFVSSAIIAAITKSSAEEAY